MHPLRPPRPARGPAPPVAAGCPRTAAASPPRLGVALLRVSVADDPAAAAARREARRAGGVAVLRADPRVRRAVLEAARWAHPHVLVARGLAVHATLADAVLGAEVLGTDGAAVRAGLAAAVPPLVAAHHERRRRSPALRARHDPVGRTAQRTLRAECGATPSSRLEPPLDALDQRGGLDELQGMYDRLHLAASDLFSPPTLGERCDGPKGLRVRLFFQDRLEIPIEPRELEGEVLLGHRPPRHRMHGPPRLAALRRAIPYGYRQLDVLRIAGDSRRRDQSQREPGGASANRFDQLGQEGAAEHRDLGVRVALEGVERERHPQRCAVPEKRALGWGQAELRMIGAACGLFHAGEPAIALEQRPDLSIGERIGVAYRLRRRQGCLTAPGAPRLALRLAAFHVVSRLLALFTRPRPGCRPTPAAGGPRGPRA